MRRPNPRREPHELSATAKWYEHRDGVIVVQEARTVGGVHLATVQVEIPWDELLEAARRLGKVKVKR